MADKLEVIIVGKDEASAAFKDVQDAADKAGDKVKATSEKLTTFGGNAAKVGGVMSLGVTAPLMMLGNASVDAASDMAESASKMEVVFGPATDSIAAFTQDAARNLGMSKQAATEAAGTFGNLFTAMGMGQQPAADMSQGVLQLSADLASFNNLEPGIVLEKLRAGLTGEAEPLKSLGIAMTAATVEAKAMEMGLAGTTAELTEGDKIAARYAIIMEQTATAQGDFARTSEGLANSSRIAKAEQADLSAEMGVVLLPVMQTLTSVLRDVIGAFSGLSPEMQTAIVVAGGLLAVIGPVATAVGAVTGAIGLLLPAFVGLTGFISATAIPAAGALIVALGPVLIPIAAIGAAVALLALAWSNDWGGIQEKTTAVVGVITSAFEDFRDSAITAWEALQTGVQGAVDGITSFIGDLSTFVTDEIPNMAANAASMGEALVNGIWDGISGLGGWLWNQLGSWIQTNITGRVQGLLGIQSPSKVFTGIGEQVGQGLANGIDGTKGLVTTAAAGLVSAVETGVAPIYGILADLPAAVSAAMNNTEFQNFVSPGGANAAEDAAIRKAAWVAAGSTDYGAMRAAGIPGFATGGIVGGALGAPVVALVHGGEMILTPEQQRGGSIVVHNHITVTGNTLLGRDSQIARELARILQPELAALPVMRSL